MYRHLCFVGLALVTTVVSRVAATGDIAALTVDQRVKAEEAIERVYWSHRIWPKDNPGPKPDFKAVMPESLLRERVENVLKGSAALEQFWNQPVTPEQLQAELGRIARDTRRPAVLEEIFRSLGDDPTVIAETLARSSLTRRRLESLYATDARFHAATRQCAETALESTSSETDLAASGAISLNTTWVRSTLQPALPGTLDTSIVPLEATEWEQRTTALAALFGSTWEQAPLDRASALQEDSDRFYVLIIRERSDRRFRTTERSWMKRPFSNWWTETRATTAALDPGGYGGYVLPSLDVASCEQDTWAPTAKTDPPSARQQHVAVWTGEEMLVWGGFHPTSAEATPARYNPLTDAWRPINTRGGPPDREVVSAVWTGAEMIVKAQGFGGNTTDRGRYDPATDSWRSMAPDPVVPIDRLDLPAVWTGTEMILWGGMSATGSVTNVGSRYNPTSDQWMPTSTGVNVPAARSRHTAVWTGSKMIIWGGDLGNNRGVTFTGGTYDPITDTWEPTPLDNVPNGRLGHTAVWSGTEMIVWGGGDPGNTGGRFDPVSNSWRPTSTGPGVPGLRADHTAVWASGKMIVWGGRFFPGSVLLNTGGIYDPVSDSWTPTAVSSGTPSARISHTTVWTGDEMIVWGGVATGVSALRNGARYRPQTDTWVPVSNGSNMPAPRSNHLAVWSGTEMIIWGGGLDSGGRYDPLLDSWTATSRGAGTPAPRTGATAVWTGSEMIVWGGNTTSQGTSNTGGRYDPIHDIWRATAISPTTPVARFDHTSVWTGSEMIVWGGFGLDSPQLKTGGRYDPSSDTWKSTSVGANVPMERRSHTAVWTGDRMIVWGGTTGFVEYLDSGGRYDPLADSWLPTVRTAETPKGRIWHTAIWTGSEMIVWGGYGNVEGYSHAGSRYDPVADRWLPLPPMIEESVSRILHTAAWTGTEMIVWGGFSDAVPYPYYLDTGERYDPVTGTWTLVSQEGHVPSVRRSHTTVWTGEEMVVWGGSGMYDLALNSGGRYCAPTNRPPQAEAGGDQRLECVNGGASVLLDGSASSDPDSTPGTDDDIVSYVWTEGALTLAEGPQVVVPLVLGAHTVRLTIRDHGGATSSDELIVTVSDQTPPNLHLDLAPQVLWPPNHRMVDVAAAITASDACGSVAIVLESVSSSEPDDSLVAQDGETSADIQGALPGTDDRAFQLRAERDGDGPGRTYTATFLAADPSGNATVATASVVVPHDRSHLDNPISLRVSNTAATTVSWQSVDTAHHFDVLRGSLRSLRTHGNGIDLGVTTCVTARVRGTSSAEQPDTAVPPRGEGYFYLVQYFDGERESSWGEPSADRPRAPGMGSPSCE